MTEHVALLGHPVAHSLSPLMQNAAFAAAGDNVVDQHLSTRDNLGYVVTDSSEPLSPQAIERLRRSEHCLWLRTW